MAGSATKAKKTCSGCFQHRALYCYRGRTRWKADHDLCFRCYRSIMDRIQASRGKRPSRAQMVQKARAWKAAKQREMSSDSNCGNYRLSA